MINEKEQIMKNMYRALLKAQTMIHEIIGFPNYNPEVEKEVMEILAKYKEFVEEFGEETGEYIH